jgi:hypothetical protein
MGNEYVVEHGVGVPTCCWHGNDPNLRLSFLFSETLQGCVSTPLPQALIFSQKDFYFLI